MIPDPISKLFALAENEEKPGKVLDILKEYGSQPNDLDLGEWKEENDWKTIEQNFDKGRGRTKSMSPHPMIIGAENPGANVVVGSLSSLFCM